MRKNEPFYPFKVMYELKWCSYKWSKGKTKFLKLINYYCTEIEYTDKKIISNKKFGLDPENFFKCCYFGNSDEKSILFIEKREGNKIVFHLYSNSIDRLKEHMICMENKVIYKTSYLSIFPTVYPIEYIDCYINNIPIKRFKRRNKILTFFLQSLPLYITPILVIYYKKILNLNVASAFSSVESIVLLTIYTLISIIMIIKIMREKHDFRF